MMSRYKKSNKKEDIYLASIDTFIERLKKVRALNCNPSDVGIDNFVLKRISLLDRRNIITRSF